MVSFQPMRLLEMCERQIHSHRIGYSSQWQETEKIIEIGEAPTFPVRTFTLQGLVGHVCGWCCCHMQNIFNWVDGGTSDWACIHASMESEEPHQENRKLKYVHSTDPWILSLDLDMNLLTRIIFVEFCFVFDCQIRI